MRRVRLKHIADITAGQSPESAEIIHTAEGLPFLQGCAEFGAKFPMTEKYCLNPPKTARKGSWLISVRAPVGTLNLADQEYCIGRGLAAVYPNGVHKGYLGYVLFDQNDFFNRISTGSTFQAISTFQLMNLAVALPLLDTQRRISYFLDEKTARIDGVIEKKRALLDRLAEKHQALITRAVTKGLESDTPLKPSGIGARSGDRSVSAEGVGGVTDAALPRDWVSKRLKYLATYNDEVLSDSTHDEKEIDYVEISGVSLFHGIEVIERMPFNQAPSRARRKVKSGDILISTVRTYLRAIAKVNGASPDLIASTGFCVVRPNDEVDNEFLGWAIKSELFISEVVARSVGVSYPAISASELVTIDMPLPPLETQRRISHFLDEKTEQIDGLITRIRDSVVCLEEYRSAIITAAVTGQLTELQ